MTVVTPEASQETDFAKIPTPAGSQAVAIPADLMAMAEAIDAKLNLPATDEQDRDANYSNAPAGITVSTPDGWQWLKTSDPGSAPEWFTVSSVESFTGFTWNTPDWNDAGGSEIIRRGQSCDVTIAAIYTGDDITADYASGYFSDLKICTIPDGWLPSHVKTFTVVCGGSAGSGQGICYASSGTVNLADMRTGAVLGNGATASLSFSYVRKAGD